MLFNESFASTNEREGSEVARQIVRALLDAQVKVVYVTHMYDLADSFRRQAVARPRFLRAEREPDGRRTFRLAKGDPLSTSYGPDLYKEIFEGAVVAATRDQRVDDGPRGGDRLATG
jgi:DNA mismatch repair ATPase MutS